MAIDPFNIKLFVLLAVGVCAVALRIVARVAVVGFRNLALDDYLMLLAMIIYGLETGAAYSVGAVYHGLANNNMTPEYRAALLPDSDEYKLRVGGSKLQLMGWSSYTLLLWLLKLCICIFYTRVTSGIQHMRFRVRLGFILIAVTYVATIGSILGGCGPRFSRNWQINPDPGNSCQPAVSRVDLFVTLVLNVVTDLYLMSIPIGLLWRVQVSLPRKAGLVLLFSLGLFVTVAGILRCWYVLHAGPDGAQQAGSWAVYETFAAVMVGNIPLIAPLFIRCVKRVKSAKSAKSAATAPSADASRNSRNTRRCNRGFANGYDAETSSQEAVLENGKTDYAVGGSAVAEPDIPLEKVDGRGSWDARDDVRGINVTTWVAVDFEDGPSSRRPGV